MGSLVTIQNGLYRAHFHTNVLCEWVMALSRMSIEMNPEAAMASSGFSILRMNLSVVHKPGFLYLISCPRSGTFSRCRTGVTYLAALLSAARSAAEPLLLAFFSTMISTGLTSFP